MALSVEMFKTLTGREWAGRSGKRESARVELAGDVTLYAIDGSKSRPAEVAAVCDVSRGGAALVVAASPEFAIGRKLALRLVTVDGKAGVLVHCEICRTQSVDATHQRVGVRFLRVLKDGRARKSAA